MGEHSLLLVDGAEHKRARKLLMPAFRPSRDGGLPSGRRASSPTTRWRRGRRGEEFRSLERMNALTLEVILRVVFGVADEERLARAAARWPTTVDIKPLILLGWGYPLLQRFGPWKKVVEVQRELDRLLYAEIAERRAATDVAGADRRALPAAAGRRREGEAPLTDAELRDQLVTLLLAGHETTAAGLAWALYELGRRPGAARAGARRPRDAATTRSSRR